MTSTPAQANASGYSPKRNRQPVQEFYEWRAERDRKVIATAHAAVQTIRQRNQGQVTEELLEAEIGHETYKQLQWILARDRKLEQQGEEPDSRPQESSVRGVLGMPAAKSPTNSRSVAMSGRTQSSTTTQADSIRTSRQRENTRRERRGRANSDKPKSRRRASERTDHAASDMPTLVDESQEMSSQLSRHFSPSSPSRSDKGEESPATYFRRMRYSRQPSDVFSIDAMDFQPPVPIAEEEEGIIYKWLREVIGDAASASRWAMSVGFSALVVIVSGVVTLFFPFTSWSDVMSTLFPTGMTVEQEQQLHRYASELDQIREHQVFFNAKVERELERFRLDVDRFKEDVASSNAAELDRLKRWNEELMRNAIATERFSVQERLDGLLDGLEGPKGASLAWQLPFLLVFVGVVGALMPFVKKWMRRRRRRQLEEEVGDVFSFDEVWDGETMGISPEEAKEPSRKHEASWVDVSGLSETMDADSEDDSMPIGVARRSTDTPMPAPARRHQNDENISTEPARGGSAHSVQRSIYSQLTTDPEEYIDLDAPLHPREYLR